MFIYSLGYRSLLSCWGFVTLLQPCLFMMNTAMMFLICQKDPASLGFILLSTISCCDQLVPCFFPCIFTSSIFDRPQYRRRKAESSRPVSRAPTFSKPSSFKKTYSRAQSLKNTIAELKPLEVFFSVIRFPMMVDKYHISFVVNQISSFS